MGTFIVPVKKPEGVARSERSEQAQRDRAEANRWAPQQLGYFPAFIAGGYLRQAARHETVDPREVVMALLLVTLLAWTLPGARMLWTEADLREAGVGIAKTAEAQA